MSGWSEANFLMPKDSLKESNSRFHRQGTAWNRAGLSLRSAHRTTRKTSPALPCRKEMILAVS
jgi:hypothetical protein